jgi:hypothetical protein
MANNGEIIRCSHGFDRHFDSRRPMKRRRGLIACRTEDAANRWFAENDPEGVAFRYEVISGPV